jgi:hypothetical protein
VTDGGIPRARLLPLQAAAPIAWLRCRRLDCGKGGSGLLVTVASSCHVQSSPDCGFPT